MPLAAQRVPVWTPVTLGDSRVRLIGATLDYLRALRIRYVDTKPDNAPSGVINIADYRGLYEAAKSLMDLLYALSVIAVMLYVLRRVGVF
jgi:hypothetical protein